jgi:ankyrin repeat protein
VLYEAVYGGRPEIVKLLLEKGANPNINMLNYGCTPLSVAAKKGDKEIVELLRCYGAAK